MHSYAYFIYIQFHIRVDSVQCTLGPHSSMLDCHNECVAWWLWGGRNHNHQSCLKMCISHNRPKTIWIMIFPLGSLIKPASLHFLQLSSHSFIYKSLLKNQCQYLSFPKHCHSPTRQLYTYNNRAVSI